VTVSPTVTSPGTPPSSSAPAASRPFRFDVQLRAGGSHLGG
jgi:hypothetical protein